MTNEHADQHYDGLYPPGSIVRRIFGDPAARILGGMREALMAAAYPPNAHAVQRYSSYESDALGRARRTMNYADSVIFGTREDAEQASRVVRAKHSRIKGTEPTTGVTYHLQSPFEGPSRDADRRLMIGGHVIIVESFMTAYHLFTHPLSPAEQDQYMDEVALTAQYVGLQVDDVPHSMAEVKAFYAELGQELRLTDDGRTLYLNLADMRRIVPSYAPLAPIYFPIQLQILATMPDEFRAVLPWKVPHRLDPLVLASGRATAALLSRPAVYRRLERVMHAPLSERLLTEGRRADAKVERAGSGRGTSRLRRIGALGRSTIARSA